ncbi:MAG: hypothetical protein MUF45_13650 [Spirosomaceae bacterium]|jgi:hypothetical protein|nr:hypothetical protein [Spirosomataceae bacterium]
MARLSEFQKATDEFNFRPLMLNKEALDRILCSPNFYALGFYVVKTKVRGIKTPIVTLQFGVLDKDKNILNYKFNNRSKNLIIDGQISADFDAKKMKETGFEKNEGLDNTSFLILKEDIVSILNILTQFKDSYCVFGIERFGKQEYKLFYHIIEIWHGGGGGPGPGVAKSPA